MLSLLVLVALLLLQVSNSSLSWQDFISSLPEFRQPSSIESLLHQEVILNERQSFCDQVLPNTANVSAPTCWNGDFIATWKANLVSKGFCDKGTKSRISCHDTTMLGQTSRVCTFDNAMLDFSKMRTKDRAGQGKNKNSRSRMFERGFLSLDCDIPEKEDQSSSDIGYFALYSPNVQNADEAMCDHYYNGTMIMYSVRNQIIIHLSIHIIRTFLSLHFQYGPNMHAHVHFTC